MGNTINVCASKAMNIDRKVIKSPEMNQSHMDGSQTLANSNTERKRERSRSEVKESKKMTLATIPLIKEC